MFGYFLDKLNEDLPNYDNYATIKHLLSLLSGILPVDTGDRELELGMANQTCFLSIKSNGT